VFGGLSAIVIHASFVLWKRCQQGQMIGCRGRCDDSFAVALMGCRTAEQIPRGDDVA